MTTLANLQNYVATVQASTEYLDQARKESAFFAKMYEKRKTKGGAEFAMPIRNGAQADNFKWMLPDNASFDYIGDTPGTNTYNAINPTQLERFAWSFGATDLVFSDLQLQQVKTAGKSQLSDYLMDRWVFSNNAMVENIGSGIIVGRGNGYQGTLPSVAGSSEAEPYGVIFQDRFFSGTANGNADKPATNTHLGLARHLNPMLVSNVLDATTGYGSDVTLTGVTLTNGNTAITGASSANYSAYVGWEILVAGQRLGREFVVADTAAGNATSLQMSSVFKGTTGTYTVVLRAPYNATQHGAAGVPTTAKLDKAYFLASDGSDNPDIALADVMTFAAIENLIKQTKQTIAVKDADWESKGYDNFKYNRSTMVIDNNMSSGRVHFVNTKYTKMFALEGMSDYKIKPKDLILLPSQAGYLQYGCAKVFPFQLVSRSPRNNAVVSGLEV